MTSIHPRICAHIVDWSASKSMPLKSDLVLNSFVYFRGVPTASDVHDHLGFFVAGSYAKDAFLFPCDFFDFSCSKFSSTSF